MNWRKNKLGVNYSGLSWHLYKTGNFYDSFDRHWGEIKIKLK
jgi:hypothetical protein